jgi:peptidoglycan/xylan/chitin deacetylase (PgdA/CDA1 family)
MPTRTTPSFVVSLDFELMWGVRDKRNIASYGRNILGIREAVPAMLTLFRKYSVRATWATVGLLLFDNKRDLIQHLPTIRPGYGNKDLSPYSDRYLASIGDDETSDPYHFGLSLARTIIDCEGMELGSHTFSHYYCLEQGQTQEEFRADLEASIVASSRLGPRPASLVFPRNQFNKRYLAICSDLGFKSYRGNQQNWMYRESPDQEQSLLQRAARLADAYLNLSGGNGFVPERVDGLANVPASRFLRPYDSRLRTLDGLRIRRIIHSMTLAAEAGRCFHLWWHPHNFGSHLRENLAFLETLLQHYSILRGKYGFTSMTMGELATQPGAPECV